MKTAILTIALALASALSALAQTVMRENSTVYFQTNVFLHDNPTNPLHQRISVEGQEPLWVAASNQVVYYLGGSITNAKIHATNIVLAGYMNGGEWAITNLVYLETEELNLGGISRASWPDSTRWSTNAATTNIDAGGYSITNIGGGYLAELRGVGYSLQWSTDEVYYGPLAYPAMNPYAWKYVDGTNVWYGRIRDVEVNRINEQGTPKYYFTGNTNSSWLESDGTNLFFVSTVYPGFTNALTTNSP